MSSLFHIIHKDIKPANILITDEDSVKICDFGLSSRRGERQDRHESIRVGSPFYAAPEQEKIRTMWMSPQISIPRA